MANRDEELDQLKREVNLTEYAATLGYALDRKSSSRNSAVMRHPGGDKIIVAKGDDGHWVYFTIGGDPKDSGSIVDFVEHREGCNLGEIRKRLRPWIGGTAPPTFARPPPQAFMADLHPVRRDVLAVRLQYEAMAPIDGHHPYLEQVRQVPPHLLTDPRFCDRIRVDGYGNAVFPHINLSGICGFELKNRNFTSFVPGGTKGLWCSRIDGADRTYVIAESAIDALSYAALHYQPGTRYVSIAGELSADQAILLSKSFEKMPDGSQIVLALDHDAGGTKLSTRIEAIFAAVHRTSLALAYDCPAAVGKDWNDVLRGTAAPGHAAPTLRPRPPR